MSYDDSGLYVDRDGTVHGNGREPVDGIDTTPSGDGWDTPEPIDGIDAMPLPSSEGRSPAPLWAMVDAVAETYQVPRELPFQLALSIVSTAVGGRRRVRVSPDWVEVPSIYTVTAMAPGERKSPTLAAMAAPLYEVEKDLANRAAVDVAQQKALRDVRAAYVEKLKKAGDTSNAALAELNAAVEDLEGTQVPEIPRLVADDTTTEALAKRMAEQGGRLGLLSAEGGLFGTLAGRYSNGVANLDLVLKAWSGDSVRIDRASRDTLILDEPVLSIGLAVQPAVLEGLTESNRFLLESGLLARFFFAIPRSLVGTRRTRPESIPDVVRATYSRKITDLAERVWSDEKTTELQLTPAASEVLDAYRAEFEFELHPDFGSLAELSATGWASKLPGQLVRIAALFTLFDNPAATTVDEHVMRDVVDLAPYLTDHAQHAFWTMAGRYSKANRPRIVLGWLRRKKLDEFSVRDARRALGGQEWAQDVDAIRVVLEELEDLGWIRQKATTASTGPGRKPSERYEVNPAATHGSVNNVNEFRRTP